MRILLLTDGLPPMTLGGTGNIVWQTALGLRERGQEVHVLTVSKQPAPPEKQDGITVHTLPFSPIRWAHYRSVFGKKRRDEVLNVIDTVKPDIIHAHSIAFQLGYTWIAGAKARGIPVLLTVHDVMHVSTGRVLGSEKSLWLKDLRRNRWTWNPFRTRIIRNIVNRHTTVLTVSDALRTFMERFGFTNLTTLHNGIETDFWKPEDQAKARAVWNVPLDKTIFLLAGRLGFDKGTTLIAQTLPKDAHLILAGHAPMEDFATIKDRISFFPNQGPEAMRTLYAACDAVLVPSRCLDCFPTVCLEGMSCERPILATSWGGAKESVEQGKTGWVLDPLNEKAWREQMQWCIDHRDKLSAYGKQARLHAVKEFSMKPYLDTLTQTYENLQQRA